MTNSTQDLLRTLDSLEQAAGRLVAPVLPITERTPDHLLLNGLQVLLFAALEEFFRNRTLEVLRALIKPSYKFTDLPESLQLQLLQESIRALGTSIAKPESDSLSMLLMEVEIIGRVGTNITAMISDYSFGRSQSNLSVPQIKNLLSSLLLDEGLASLTEVAKLANLSHLGAPDQVFSRLAANRHSAAHGFAGDFKLADFQQDIKAACRSLALAFDTCISQAAYYIRDCLLNNTSYNPIKAERFKIQIIRYDSIKNSYLITAQDVELNSVPKSKFAKKLQDLRERKGLTSETIFVMDAMGKLVDWVQPI